VNIGTLSTPTVLSDKKLHKMVARQVSSVFTISFDDEVGLTYNQAIPVLRIDALGSSIDTSTGIAYFSGIFKDAKLWKGGDRNTGALVLDLPIDEDWTKGNVVRNRAAQLSGELVSGDLAKAGNATLEGNTITNTGGWAYAFYDIPTVVGKTYLVSMDVETTGDTKWGAKAWAIPSYPVLASHNPLNDGKYVFVFTATTELTRVGAEFNSAVYPIGGTLTVNSISAKEIPSGYPYATAINITEADAEKFTKVDNGANWLGEELVNPSLMAAINTGTSTSTYENGVGHIQTSGDYTALRQSDSLTVGTKYRATFNITDYVEGLGVIIGENAGDGRDVSIHSDGMYITDFSAQVPALQFKRWDVATDMKLSGISTKRLIPIDQGVA